MIQTLAIMTRYYETQRFHFYNMDIFAPSLKDVCLRIFLAA